MEARIKYPPAFPDATCPGAAASPLLSLPPPRPAFLSCPPGPLLGPPGSLPVFSGGRPLRRAHLGLCLTLAFLSCLPGPLTAFSGGRPLRWACLGLCLTLAFCLQPVLLLRYSEQRKHSVLEKHFIWNGAFLIGQLCCSVIRPSESSGLHTDSGTPFILTRGLQRVYSPACAPARHQLLSCTRISR